MRLIILAGLLVALSGCGKGVCGPIVPDATSVESPCGLKLYLKDGKAYTDRAVPGYSFQSRYYPMPTKAGTAQAVDGCVYELTPGWYGDAECAFPVSP